MNTRIEQVQEEQRQARADGAFDTADICAQEIRALELGYITPEECAKADRGHGDEPDRRYSCLVGLNGWWRSGTSYDWPRF